MARGYSSEPQPAYLYKTNEGDPGIMWHIQLQQQAIYEKATRRFTQYHHWRSVFKRLLCSMPATKHGSGNSLS
jgi:hypothetical protein